MKNLKAAAFVAAVLLPVAAFAGPEVGSGGSAQGSPDPSKNERGHGMSSKDGQTYKHWSRGGGGHTKGNQPGNDGDGTKGSGHEK
jgi:hypothetical protein